MCGFLAEYTFNSSTLTSEDSFNTLLRLSKHRGPDSTLVCTDRNYQLGFNRLAIIDLSENGNQPKLSPSGRFNVVFNGEIYNYRKLKKKFQLSNLQSTSDTEVLVHLFDELGVEKTVKELNGMFAIALVDTLKDQMYLIRDFAGIKPLFYGVSEQGIVAASQFDQVFKHLWFKDTLSLRPEIMKEYFGFGYMQAPNTIFDNIYQVNPGEYLKISKDSSIETIVFKRYDSNGVVENMNDPVVLNIFETHLKNSAEQQLVSDVPLAAFLSGGIDSPLITALAKEKKSNIEAFTISVKDEQLDESEPATNYANHLKIAHQVETVNDRDLIDSIDSHFEKFPEPFGDYSSIPTYLITKVARKKYTVMLSGDGGDELFYGYPRFLDVIEKKFWFSIPFSIRKPIIRITNKLNITNTWAPYHYKTLGQFIREKHTHIFESTLNSFFPDTNFSEEMNKLYDYDNSMTPKSLLEWLQFNEIYGHLQRVLIKVDRMSMANSMEVRVPFLDKKVMEEAMTKYPNEFKSSSDLKKVLKNILRNYYPDKIIYKQKKGFAVPIGKWLKNQLAHDVKRLYLIHPSMALR